MATANDVLKIARSQLYYKEYPPDSNNTKFGEWYGVNRQPWCAIFVMWCFHFAGAINLLPVKTASCTSLMKAAKMKGMWVTGGYQPGDIVIYDWGKDNVPDHCGIVETVSGKTVTAIEGNTDIGNDSNGGQVMRRDRPVSQILGAVRWEEEMNIDTLTDADILKLANRLQAVLGKQKLSSGLKPEVENAVKLGITDGSSPNAFCTRAQAAVMAQRAAQK